MKEKLILHVTKLAQEQKRWKRWHKTVTVMAAVVVFCTVYALILPAVTMGAKTFCGMEEHIHTEECYLLRRIGASTPSDAERWDIDEELGTPSNARLEERLEEMREFCLTEGGKGTASNGDRATASNAMEYEWDENDKYKYDMNLIGDDSFLLDDYLEYTEGMEYDEDNYELIRICEMEEHTHSLICYSDPEADLEDEAVWTQTIPELTGNIPEDLIRVAESQMNYRESEKNYQVEGVDEKKGYSRYGQWYGEPYGDWGTMFVSFCMNYAGVENAPMTADFDSLMQSMKGGVPELYREKDYIPKPGDLVFAAGAAGEPGRVGVITEVTLDDKGNVSKFTAVEGDYENRVTTRTHRGGEEDIRGFAALSKFGPDEEIVIITLKAETENAVVTATFEKDTLPENVKMEAEEISKEDPKAVEMREKLAEQGKSEGKVLTAMIPLNIAFLDEEGNAAEPAGPVQYSVEFKTPVKSVDAEDGEGHSETSSAFDEETPEETAASSEEQEIARIEEEADSDPERIETENETETAVSEIIETGRAGISAKETVRVGTAIEGAVIEDDARTEEAEDESKTQEGPSWQLFSQSQDGILENRSSDDKTKIEVKEDGAVAEVGFEVGGGQSGEEDPNQGEIQAAGAGNMSMYLAAYRTAELSTVYVKTIQELKNALTNDDTQVVILDTDIDVQTDEEAGYLPISMEGKTKILNLNGKSITVHRTEKSLIDVRNDSNLTIRDELAAGNSEGRETVHDLGAMENLLPENDGVPVAEETVGLGSVYEVRGNGERVLKFYVTTSQVTDKANGKTREWLEEHIVTNPGVIKVTSPGNTAAFSAIYVYNSTLNLESGAIVGCNNRAINLEGSSTLNLKGGYLCGNTSPDRGGAIRAVGDSKINLPVEKSEDIGDYKGTCISGNTSLNGGAIYLGENSDLTVLKGYITNNQATNGSGGAIYADGGRESTINLRAGYITNNKATYSGGGIYKTSLARLIIGEEDQEPKSDGGMNPGGTVARNLALNGEGGGITVIEGQVKFISGYITNNRTDTHQHWGGGGVFISDGAYGYMENALVTENTAGGFGGGVTGCPTSRVFIADTSGMAIYGNKGGEKENVENHLSGASSSKPHDHKHMYGYDVFMDNGYDDYFCALTCTVGRKMLGGGSAKWSGSYDGNVISSGASEEESQPLQCTSIMGLNANPSPASISAAQQAAKIFFSGNSSWTHAGGILCNGYMFVGGVEDIHTPDRIAVEGWKTLENKDGGNIPLTSDRQFEFEVFNQNFASLGVFGNKTDGTINFQLMLAAPKDGTFIYYINEKDKNSDILSDSTVYKIVLTVGKKTEVIDGVQFPDYPETMYGNKKYTYTIDDVKLYKRFDGKMTDETGWGEPMSGDIWDKNGAEQGHDTLYLNGRNKESFVNREKGEETTVAVRKKWNVPEGTALPASVQVQLLRDGTPVEFVPENSNPVTLSAENNWEYAWKNLPVKDSNGKLYTYTVKEIGEGVNGYHSEITVSQNLWGTAWKEAETLEAGKSYIILNQSKNKMLRISSAHQDKFFTKSDWVSFDINNASGLDLGSVFMAEHPTEGSGEIVLSTGLITGRSWLRIENGSSGNLKGTSGAEWSSPFAYVNGQLTGALGANNQWDGSKEYRVIFGGKTHFRFDAQRPSTDVAPGAATVYTLEGEAWKKATALEAGKTYVIVYADKVLTVDPESPDDEFRKEDWVSISEDKRSNDEFAKDAFGQNSIFTAEYPDDNHNFLILRAVLSNSQTVWLSLEERGESYLKSTIGSQYASSFEIAEDSFLKGKYGSWKSDGVDKWIVILKSYEEVFPDAVTDGTGENVVLYEKIVGDGETGVSGPLFTITNTPIEEKRFNLHIKKVSAINPEEKLKGAGFELKKNNANMGFEQTAEGENGSYRYTADGKITTLITGEQGEIYISGLPQGTYVLHETQAPPGYSTVEDQTIVIDGTQNTDIYLDPIKEPVYVLPETGGDGKKWYAFGGMLFMMAGGLVYGYSSRRRRERRYES